MTRLQERIVSLIGLEGPITVERFMSICLGDRADGYYAARDPIGAGGDFITAPEISQIFGELIGLWAATAWQSLAAPDRVNLIELGPGRGTLMADALRAARVSPSFLAAVHVHLVETSPVLRAAQEKTLVGVDRPVAWHESLETVPLGPAVVIANEFFDALPIRQFVSRDGVWLERLVGLDSNGQLAFGLSATPVQGMSVRARDNDLLEVGFSGLAMMETLAARLVAEGGAALVIDYGHAETGFGETLQAVRGHAYADPLQGAGSTDLTAHVDFGALLRQARAVGARAHGPVTQATLLERLGARERAAMLKRGGSDPAIAAGIDVALARLTGLGKDGMGRLFKAITVTAAQAPIPAGFEAPDPLLKE